VPEQFVLLHELKHERLGVYFLLGALFYMNREKVIYHWLAVAILSAITFLAFGSRLYNLVFAVWFSYVVLYISFHKHIRFPDLGKHGDFSYGLYLYAFPMSQLSIYLFGAGNPWMTAVITFVTAMILAMGSWFLVEKPTLRLKGSFSQVWSSAFARAP
jgi:peptidoglycan/LPS O-acetylase OafA/YrhL